MKRIEEAQNAIAGATGAKADANRFYSILLDARASSVADSMYDVAEKLLTSEKDNAKQALERLWALKKNVQGSVGGATVDLLVQHYQEKIDLLRDREERFTRISRDSRKLLEEKRRRDAEIATVKQSLGDLNRDITRMQEDQKKLQIREQELILIDTQLSKELEVNEGEIVNGLYEIILPEHNPFGSAAREQATEAREQATEANDAIVAQKPEPRAPLAVEEPFEAETTQPAGLQPDTDRVVEALHPAQREEGRVELLDARPPYPKSVVKTTRGRIIGEYYYDAGVYKNRRHYILNSRFFLDQCESGLFHGARGGDDQRYNDLVQMVQDAYRRIVENETIHFEVSTNEVLNAKTLKELWGLLKTRSFDEVQKFAARLKAKIAALGTNYHGMLVEQMQRLVGAAPSS